MGAVIKYAEYIMGVVFKLRMIALSPQIHYGGSIQITSDNNIRKLLKNIKANSQSKVDGLDEKICSINKVHFKMKNLIF